MSSPVSARLIPQILIRDCCDSGSDHPDGPHQLGFPARSISSRSAVSIEKELRSHQYTLIVWRISPAETGLAALHEFLQTTSSTAPVLVVAPAESRGTGTGIQLAELSGDGISDFCFDDEPAILSRSVGRILREQEAIGRRAISSTISPAISNDLLEGADALAAFIEACPLAVVALSAKGEVLLWNSSASKIYGWRPEEVIGHTLPTVPAEGEDEFRGLLEAQMHGIAHTGKELRRRRKDGTIIDISLWTTPLRDKQGRIRAKLALSADITERLRAERERLELLNREQEAHGRAQSMDRFRELLEAAPDGIIEVDETGRILLLNAATEQLFGYARKELLGLTMDRLVPEEQRSRHAMHRARYAQNPSTRPMGGNIELYGQRKDGTQFPVEISLSPVKSAEGFRVSAIIRDVSERKQAEQQIRHMHEAFTAELSLANRQLEAHNQEIKRADRYKSEFLASMSHELRTPLHTIIGFAQLLGEQFDGALNPKQKRFVDHIHRDSLHLLDLINGILDLSKIEAGKLELHTEYFSPKDAVSEVIDSVTPLAASKSISLEHHSPEPFGISADRMRFKQILYNLLSNAVKFTPAGGRVSVDYITTASLAQFCVSDTGIGIPEDERAAVFEKFHQVGTTGKSASEGTGLGLAITKALIEQHGGAIWLESEAGRGTRFYFTLPFESTGAGDNTN